ncbi:hypothetical protein [Spongiactinospora sp. TRM90649]|uniref:nSTAND3 domain-containing NTPase n=1 Tax=Spongiactinospora sp. TRM90649 TaxID=3031114 RepID=UPI0023F6C18D|nr:hypothetical protein [Spongiactinospora sp. TRM90649]MDF5753153.1 hypothetical protein [Spongiactinospora sp. TRM90649]
MNDQFIYNIGHADGDFLLGNGDISDLLRDSSGKMPRGIVDDQLVWLRRNFVHPRGFARARSILGEYRTVFIRGVPGSGRRTAANMLLYELREKARTFQELLLQENRPHHLDLEQVGNGDLLLLDLIPVQGTDCREVCDELGALRKTVKDRAAHLAVVLSDHAARTLSSDLRRLVVEMAAPGAEGVLRRHLRSAGIIVLPEQPWPSPILHHLRTGPSLDQVAHYADLVAEARAKSGGRGDLQAWSKAVNNSRSKLDVGLPSADGEPEGRRQALLMATAMLHGAHADDIHQASNLLLQALEHDGDEQPILERTDLATRFKKIDAYIKPRSREVLFRSFDYDYVVRQHFWRNIPEIRDPLRKWVQKALTIAGLDQRERDLLVERFTELCLDERYRPMLMPLVEDWSARGNKIHLRAAALTLRQGLLDEENGQFFRRQIYESATAGEPSHGLRFVLVRACSDVIAVRHPDEAMVRLHHLARRERDGILARETLTELACGKHRHHRFMLRRLEEGLQRPRRWPVDFDLFHDLTAPDALTAPGPDGPGLLAEPEMRHRLTNGWRAVFTHHAERAKGTRVRDWLTAARDRETYREALLDVLVSAATPRIQVLAPLYTTARDLPYTTEEERQRGALLAKTLRQKIAAATKNHKEGESRT